MPKQYKPYHPPEYDKTVVIAFQMLQKGEAAPHQQQLVLDYVINNIAHTYDMSYFPESQRDTDFAEGKRFVGNEIIKMLKLKVGLIKEATNVYNEIPTDGR